MARIASSAMQLSAALPLNTCPPLLEREASVAHWRERVGLDDDGTAGRLRDPEIDCGPTAADAKMNPRFRLTMAVISRQETGKSEGR